MKKFLMVLCITSECLAQGPYYPGYPLRQHELQVGVPYRHDGFGNYVPVTITRQNIDSHDGRGSRPQWAYDTGHKPYFPPKNPQK